MLVGVLKDKRKRVRKAFMKEIQLRKWHRRVGIWMALFIMVQAGSGLLIGLEKFEASHSHARQTAGGQAHSEARELKNDQDEGESLFEEILEWVHHGGGLAGGIYRLVVGLSLIFMAVTGIWIYFKIRTRSLRI